jgi:hypothetical protein
VVDNYDFANGAPAVGASLDLLNAPEVFRAAYDHKRDRKNLFRYFVKTRLANILAPSRHFFTTNDPVMTPAMLDYFFNQKTQVFSTLDDRKRLLLRSIYDDDAYAAVLPAPTAGAQVSVTLRQHQRFSIRCPAKLWVQTYGTRIPFALTVIELSLHGFQAECSSLVPEGVSGRVEIELGEQETAAVDAVAVRRHESNGAVFYGFSVLAPDTAWVRCVKALNSGRTHADLRSAGPNPAPAAPAERSESVAMVA